MLETTAAAILETLTRPEDTPKTAILLATELLLTFPNLRRFYAIAADIQDDPCWVCAECGYDQADDEDSDGADRCPVCGTEMQPHMTTYNVSDPDDLETVLEYAKDENVGMAVWVL